MDALSLLICFSATALMACHGFSVDTERPIIFQEAAEGFGQTIVQFGRGADGGVLVGAPLQRGNVNETGKIYKCEQMPGKSGRCQEVPVQHPSDAVNMSLGLSLSAWESRFLACGPRVHQTCGQNTYLKSYCFLLDQNLREIQHFPDVLPECAKRANDIVLLIDGSGSIDGQDFRQMKTFISEIMKRLLRVSSNTQFALAQYSNKYKEHFTFSQFQNNPNPDALVRGVAQLRGGTYTATFIQKVVREVFQPHKGSHPGATKILIVITDGQKEGDLLEYSDVIPEAETAGIIRYAIGVGRAFSLGAARQELNDIASRPSSEHVFPVSNFNALKDIENKLQDKIFAIEGTESQSSSSFQLEMSQEGLSALVTPDGFVLGAVGAYDWSGGLFLYGSGGDPNFINVTSSTKDMNDAYLGYSVQMVQLGGRRSYVVGAPRYKHIGRVVLFSQENGQWQRKSDLSLKQTPQIGSYFGASLCSVDLDRNSDTDLVLIGAPMHYDGMAGGKVYVFQRQIGSYFGASLCSVDLDRNSDTDLVLIGAPMHYDGMAGGKVYVFQRQGETFVSTQELQGERKYPLGRFGACIAEIGDITGDGWMDVAIGAPMEDANRGALYIFQGRYGSINPQYSQHIRGSRFPNQLHYFGQAVAAGTDLTEDGLPDIATGARGQVLLLSITFSPSVIPLSAFECQGQDQLDKEVSTATVCLTVRLNSPFTPANRISSTVWYSLVLDPGRMKVRAAFDSGSSTLTNEMQMGLAEKCMTYRIKLPVCIEDSLTPIKLQLNYNLTGDPIPSADNLRAILKEDSPRLFAGSLPFEKNCGHDGVCKDILKTAFNFSGLDMLVVGQDLELNVTVFFRNDGEDSYGSNVTFVYPSALSYRRFKILQSNRKNMGIKCSSAPASREDSLRNTTCNINHPIFRSGAEVIFTVAFSIDPEGVLGSEVQINATAGSENNSPVTRDMFHQAALPVKYAIYVSVKNIDDSTKYVNFSMGHENGNQTVEHHYEVRNSIRRQVPVSVTFEFPVQLNGMWVWNASVDMSTEQFHQAHCALEKKTPGSKDFVNQLHNRAVLDCTVAACETIRCNILSLEQGRPLEFRIRGALGFGWLSQTQQKKVAVQSTAQIFYDDTKYSQKEGFIKSQLNTVVEYLEVYNYLPVIIGSSVGGFVLLALIIAALYKFGFFNRQYKQMLDEAGEGDAGAGPPPGSDSGPGPQAAKA
ncbi:PREDICTED: integrin alpha-M-like [Gekko japonicus]|uniref:Integrin alpha-M-like n=1 Tax=Gekko japonicus TaxID=146911 RepID=A0ABM1JK15_GEKJA|nr:PREDICTED: integrin alpha-M-like [Gekko japonicus]